MRDRDEPAPTMAVDPDTATAYPNWSCRPPPGSARVAKSLPEAPARGLDAAGAAVEGDAARAVVTRATTAANAMSDPLRCTDPPRPFRRVITGWTRFILSPEVLQSALMVVFRIRTGPPDARGRRGDTVGG